MSTKFFFLTDNWIWEKNFMRFSSQLGNFFTIYKETVLVVAVFVSKELKFVLLSLPSRITTQCPSARQDLVGNTWANMRGNTHSICFYNFAFGTTYDGISVFVFSFFFCLHSFILFHILLQLVFCANISSSLIKWTRCCLWELQPGRKLYFQVVDELKKFKVFL